MTFPFEKRVLVVCHGNINRSPLCAATLRAEGLEHVNEAALKYNGGGERAAAKMRRAAAELGLDLERHRSTAITTGILEAADIVVYMDNGNLNRIMKLADRTTPPRGQKWICLGEYAEPQTKRIPDPAYMAKDSPEFAEVVPMIYRASIRLAHAILGGEV